MMKVVRLAFLTTGAITAGCQGPQQPSVQLAPPRITELTPEAILLHVDLEIHNPNAEPLELFLYEYEVRVPDHAAYLGQRAALATVPARDRQFGTLPAVVILRPPGSSEDDLPAPSRYSLSGTLQYKQPGKIAEALFESGLYRPKVSFSASGDLNMPQAE